MRNSIKRIALALVILGSMAALSRPAHAGFHRDTYDLFGSGGSTVAAGSFTYDNSHQGTTLSYGDLSTFNFSIEGGRDYDLNFLRSTTPSQYFHFAFNTSTTSFTPALIDVSPTLFAAVAGDFGSGFFVGDIAGGNNSVEDYATGVTYHYDSIIITTSFVSVPEPSSLALCGIAGAIGVVVARVRRKPAA